MMIGDSGKEFQPVNAQRLFFRFLNGEERKGLLKGGGGGERKDRSHQTNVNYVGMKKYYQCKPIFNTLLGKM